MPSQYSHADFQDLSWHDNIVYGLRFDMGDSLQGSAAHGRAWGYNWRRAARPTGRPPNSAMASIRQCHK